MHHIVHEPADVPRRKIWSMTLDTRLSRHTLHPPMSAAEIDEVMERVEQALDQDVPTYIFYQVHNFRNPDGTASMLYLLFLYKLRQMFIIFSNSS